MKTVELGPLTRADRAVPWCFGVVVVALLLFIVAVPASLKVDTGVWLLLMVTTMGAPIVIVSILEAGKAVPVGNMAIVERDTGLVRGSFADYGAKLWRWDRRLAGDVVLIPVGTAVASASTGFDFMVRVHRALRLYHVKLRVSLSLNLPPESAAGMAEFCGGENWPERLESMLQKEAAEFTEIYGKKPRILCDDPKMARQVVHEHFSELAKQVAVYAPDARFDCSFSCG